MTAASTVVMADNDGFQIVKGKRSRRNKVSHSRPAHVDSTKDSTVDSGSHFDIEAFKRKLNICLQEIVLSEFFACTHECIEHILSKMVSHDDPRDVKDYHKEDRVNPIEERDSPREERVNPIEERDSPREESVNPIEERDSPREERVNPSEERDSPREERVNPSEERDSPREERVNPSEERDSPREESVNPIEERDSPREERVNPSEERDSPREERVNPSDYLNNASHRTVMWPKVDLLSYGLGNFTFCPIARYQLALLMVLRQKLGIPSTSCFLYDPVFTKHEQDFLHRQGFEVIKENEEGKRVCHVPTIAFLPHCGKALYNNLIWRNLSTPQHEGLRNLLLLGNSFANMMATTPSRLLEKTAGYIIKVQPLISEIALPTTFHHKDVFNDLALHSFPKDKLVTAASIGDSDLPEPEYDLNDVEMVVK